MTGEPLPTHARTYWDAGAWVTPEFQYNLGSGVLAAELVGAEQLKW